MKGKDKRGVQSTCTGGSNPRRYLRTKKYTEEMEINNGFTIVMAVLWWLLVQMDLPILFSKKQVLAEASNSRC